jgi:DNA mismatch repair protein MutS
VKAVEQLALFATLPHPVVEKLRGVDLDNLTPLKALQLLAELQRDANG